MPLRPVKQIASSKPTREGAGVNLRRASGFGNTADIDSVAWYGPIVMNTKEQLQQAFTELEEGTFLKR